MKIGINSTSSMSTTNVSRFDRGSWIALAFALFIFVYTAAGIIYDGRLPHDGWVYSIIIENKAIELELLENILDLPSELRPKDVVIAIDGKPVTQLYSESLVFYHPPPSWPDEHHVAYTVRRGDELLTLDVPFRQFSPTEFFGALQRFYGVNYPAQIISSILFLVIGVFVFIRRPRERSAQALLLIGTGFFFQWLSIPDSMLHYFYPFTGGLYASINSWTNAIVPSLAYIILSFPTAKWPLRRFPRLTVASLYLPFTPAFLVAHFLLQNNPIAWRQTHSFISISPLLWVLLSLPILVHTLFTTRGAVAQAQMKWLAFGMGCFILIGIGAQGISANTTDITFALIVNLIGTLGWLMLPICLAIALLRYRLFDIDIIIRRTLRYSVLSGLLALTYFGSVVALQRIFTALTGQGQNQLVTVVSTLALAALFAPLRRRVQDVIDRRFYRKKYNAAKTLAAFAATCRDETDLDKLTASLVSVVQETKQQEHVSLWLKPTQTRPDRSRASGPVRSESAVGDHAEGEQA